MPGFNKKGPQNQGPMTGGRRGICICDTDKPQEERPLGRGPGIGGKRVNGAGRRGGCGMGRGFNDSAGNGRGRGMGRPFR